MWFRVIHQSSENASNSDNLVIRWKLYFESIQDLNLVRHLSILLFLTLNLKSPGDKVRTSEKGNKKPKDFIKSLTLGACTALRGANPFCGRSVDHGAGLHSN
jgi:hypothetical protein